MITTDKILTLLSKLEMTEIQLAYTSHGLLGFVVVTAFQFSILAMIISVTTIAIGKELFDKYVKKTMFDWKDVMCTLTGGLFGFFVTLIYK